MTYLDDTPLNDISDDILWQFDTMGTLGNDISKNAPKQDKYMSS